MDRSTSRQDKLPLSLKIFLVAFSVTLAVHNGTVYGPPSLLYICDIALFAATIGVCFESSLAVSFAAVAAIGVQLLWSVDLLLTAAGAPSFALTRYMLIDDLPWIKRALSMFHAWLPIVLLYALSKLGYRRVALPAWLIACSGVLLICYGLSSPPQLLTEDPYQAVNVNYVFGFSGTAPQAYMAPEAWLGTLMLGLALFIFLPTHMLLSRCFPVASSSQDEQTDGVVLCSQPMVVSDEQLARRRAR